MKMVKLQITVSVPPRVKTYLDAVSYEKGISRSSLASMLLTQATEAGIMERKVFMTESYPVEIVGQDVILTIGKSSYQLSPMSASRSKMLENTEDGIMVGPVYKSKTGYSLPASAPYDMWVVDFENMRCRPMIPAEDIWPNTCFECEKACLHGDDGVEEPRSGDCPMPEA